MLFNMRSNARISEEADQTMWASSPMPSTPSPCVPRLRIASATSKPAERCFALPVSNKSQRRRPPKKDGDHNNSAQEIGVLGLSVLTALKSNPQGKPVNPRGQNTKSPIKSSNSKPPPQQQDSGEQQERQLSGSDVLLALQRATAQKIKKKRRDYPSPSSTSKVAKDRVRSGTERADEEDTSDYSNARPICIKSDWTTHLDELEKRLQELIDATT